MKRGFSGVLALLALALVPGISEAATRGFSTANVNMRSGPGTNYPAVVVIPSGSSLVIHGCLREVPWCDVSFTRGRGWVAGNYIQAVYRQNRVYVEPRYYQSLGVPLIDFDVGVYWDRYYRDRNFYRERDRWRERDRDRWRQPPRPPVDSGWRDREPDRRPDNNWGGGRPDPDWRGRPDRDRGEDFRPRDDRGRDRDSGWRQDDNDRNRDRGPDGRRDRDREWDRNDDRRPGPGDRGPGDRGPGDRGGDRFDDRRPQQQPGDGPQERQRPDRDRDGPRERGENGRNGMNFDRGCQPGDPACAPQQQ